MTVEPIRASIHIEASPDLVFEYFTRADAMLRWMGEHAVLDPHSGGRFAVDIRGVPVRGTYLEIDPPHRLLISWGHAGSDRLPPGASRLEVRLDPTEGGTTVTIVHQGLPEPEATKHERGWTYFLGQLAEALATAATHTSRQQPARADDPRGERARQRSSPSATTRTVRAYRSRRPDD